MSGRSRVWIAVLVLTPLAALVAAYVLLFLLGMFVLGDPGYQYNPVDGHGRPIAKWSRTVDGLTLEGGPYSTLIGSGIGAYGYRLTNRSDKGVTLLGGTLLTDGRSLEADTEGALPRSFAPGTSGDVSFTFDFRPHGGDAEQVLGKNLTWIWRLRVGDRERTIEVKMLRE